ncbi:MAG TPA: 1-acyl-sn-glycerol-3-phosphate acyltransferase [Isosphaeraceae bacterium]
MDRLQLREGIEYEFIPPKVGRFWLWLGRLYARRVYLKQHGVASVDVDGLEHLSALLGRGDGVMIAPNHADLADSGVMLELGRNLGRVLYFMAAYQIFQINGRAGRFLLPRVGAFPVDREGADLRAFKTAVEILGKGHDPLVIFPEGEIYHVNDRLTPLREGAAAVATTAAKRAGERGKTVWIVPMGIKYRFLDGADRMPALQQAMARLESRFGWWPREGHCLVDRIHACAEAMLGLKEMELLGATRQGTIKERIGSLRDAILDGLEYRHFGKRRDDTVPVRVKELRHAFLEKLAGSATTPECAASLRRDLYDVFLAVQLFSYPGDYLRETPTVERIAETVRKFEQDALAIEPEPYAMRRAVVRLGEPIDVRERMTSFARPRLATGAITTELEARIQSVLDAIGPGRPVPAEEACPPIVPRLATAGAAPVD